MMFRCEKAFSFEASHVLSLHDGKCRRLHGHSFVGRVVCEGEELAPFGPKTGMLVDYTDIKALVADLTERYLDHWHLNDSLAPFGITNPTSEVIAKWVYDQLRPFLPQLAEVQIEETCTCRAVYRPTVKTEYAP